MLFKQVEFCQMEPRRGRSRGEVRSQEEEGGWSLCQLTFSGCDIEDLKTSPMHK